MSFSLSTCLSYLGTSTLGSTLKIYGNSPSPINPELQLIFIN